MTQIFLGSHFLENKDSFRELPQTLFDLIDVDGVNVVQDTVETESLYHCVCHLKFVRRSVPFEVFITFPKDVYNKIVHEYNLEELGKVH